MSKHDEKLKVHIKYHKGHTICICLVNNKGCLEHCPVDEVTHDRYKEWRDTMENTHGTRVQ